ncbi:MAG: hypothetical protein QXU01_03815 [Candidatus Hadarchaeales archaeon]
MRANSSDLLDKEYDRAVKMLQRKKPEMPPKKIAFTARRIAIKRCRKHVQISKKPGKEVDES